MAFTRHGFRLFAFLPSLIVLAAAGQPAAAASMMGSAGQTIDCSQLGTVKTGTTGPAGSLTFKNDTDGYRSVFWIDKQGQPKPYRNLDAGKKYTQSTHAGSVWMITDGPGNCTEIYVAPAGKTTFHITAEADGGGGD